MRVGWRETGRIEIEDVTRFRHRLGPRRSRHGKNLEFDHALLVAQQFLPASIGVKHAADIGGLCRHAAMLSRSIGISVTWRTRIDALRVDRSTN